MCFKPSGEPHAVYQGSYLVPIMVRLFCLASSAVETLNMPFKAEALAIPTSARLDRISEFLRSGPVTFDTLVLHTGSGDIVPLSTYFNRQGLTWQCPYLYLLSNNVPFSANYTRHLTKLDELNDLFYGHAAQEDGIVVSQVTRKLQLQRFDSASLQISPPGPWVE